MTDTVTYFSDQHLTWLSQLKPNAKLGPFKSPYVNQRQSRRLLNIMFMSILRLRLMYVLDAPLGLASRLKITNLLRSILEIITF